MAGLCIAAGGAQGQSNIPSLPSIANIAFSVDSANCSFNDPNLGTIWNSGTISITINNNETESATYQCETVGTAYDYIQNLANNINKNSPWVIAAPVSDFSSGAGGGVLRLISKVRGAATNYPISASATYNTNNSYQDATGNLVPDFTGPAYISSAPATMNTFASRNFAMAVFGDTGVGPADEDIAFMSVGSNLSQTGGNDLQPAGLSIMDLSPSAGQYNLPQKDFQGNVYDYSRIAAVYVDEPFDVATGLPWTNPCHDSRYQNNIVPIYHALQALAQQIKQQTPKTRLWVNYSEPEVQWMQDTTCGANSMAILNSSFMDVVSMDKYSTLFPGTTSCLVPQKPAGCVQPYYDWLIAHRAYPGQQIALVPGIWANTSGSNANSQASLLQGFFDYATSQNQVCNNPLGNTGATGHADGCLVWMVIGFAAHQNSLGIGEDDPGAEPIQQVWRAQVGLPLTIPLTRPSSLATVLSSSGTPFTYFLTSGGQVYDIWCTTSGCAWDDPSGDAHAPAAVYGSSLNVVATANGLIAYFLTSNGHLISLNTSNGFSDTWQDITADGGNFSPVVGSALVTVSNPFTYFFTGSGQVIDNWCTSSTSCSWDDPSGDANAPAAAPGSPLTVISTSNGLIAYFVTSNGHLISLNTSHGFSDTWQDVTADGGNFSPAAGSPLVTVLNGQTPFTYFFTGSGQVIDNWCTTSTSCSWDDPSGDAKAPAAASGSPLNVVATSSGLIAYYLTSSGHVIALNTSNGFSDTWKDITSASGAPAAVIESSLTTVVSSNGTVISHFVVPGQHLYSISCTVSGQCTSTDETASANAAPVGFF